METVYTKRYFISRHGRQAGPFTKEDLRAMGISAETPVWNEELFNWTMADTIEELKDVLSTPPPVVPPGPKHWWRIGRKRRS